MADLTIKLREGRVSADVYADTALVAGYEAKITQTTEHTEENVTDNYVAPDGATNVQHFTQDDGTVDVTYTLTTEIDNPVSATDFGKAVVRKRFAEQDAQLEADAVKLRAEAGYAE